VRIVNVKAVFASSALLLALAAPAAAQGQSGAASSVPQPELGAGLSFLDSSDTGTGITVDYGHPVVPFTWGALSAVGDLGLNHFDGATVSSYLGGVRVKGNVAPRISPFGQFLVGAEHCCGVTDFTLQPGVGVDVAINRMLNVRAQVDFRTVQAEQGNVNTQRYTFGVVLPILAGR